MSTDPTQPQDTSARTRSREMSLEHCAPPAAVPGYEPQRCLGRGAYGEVWVEVDQNTGRQVAVKFYHHRGGLDWSLLSREVEKLAFLFADRYVVQLLGVGWEAEPPYYVMEYLPKGSLADRLEEGPLPAEQAVVLFEEVAVGLLHAHGKGVLHCDLKPANILLDQDDKPRLADFGQSRLSHEQSPALGTLFYMAPEQADLEAVPDARWDVYALGALLYCMLTGSPPYRTAEAAETLRQAADLPERLARYRRMIAAAPRPAAHRRVRGVDSMLAEIIDRCLERDPDARFANVQAVLDALQARRARLARRPVMVLGAVGPALLLLVVCWFAWQGFRAAIGQSDGALTQRALESNGFAARYAARTAAHELENRFQLVERLAASPELRTAAAETVRRPEFDALLAALSDSQKSDEELAALRRQFRVHPARQALQRRFAELLPPAARPEQEDEVASWFFCDARGVSTARVPEGVTIGKNFAWRSYFHGGPSDLEETWRSPPGKHLRQTTLSDVFRSQATQRWIVAVSAPVFDPENEERFLGVLAVTAEVGRFVELSSGHDQFAVLVDQRQGPHQGVILQHPLYDRLLAREGRLPDRFQNYRLHENNLPDDQHPELQQDYPDPLTADPAGQAFRRHWLARAEPVVVRGRQTGWVVIVQQAHDTAIGATLRDLQAGLVRYGLMALALVALVMATLWVVATRLELQFRHHTPARGRMTNDQ